MREGSGLTSARRPGRAAQKSQVPLVRCSQAHCAYNIVDQFWRAAAAADERLRPVLSQLCALYALHVLESYAADLLRLGFWRGADAKVAADAVRAARLPPAACRTPFHRCHRPLPQLLHLCGATRQQAAGLVDTFNLSDFIIGSPMGRWDGDVYSHYFSLVRSYPGQAEHASYYEDCIAPVLRGDHAIVDAE